MPDERAGHDSDSALVERRSTMVDGVTAMESRENRRAIPVRCLAHGGSEGLSVLRVERRGEEIVLAPHVSGACVIVPDEAAAATLFDVLGMWLG
jgi:hypothetical protein